MFVWQYQSQVWTSMCCHWGREWSFFVQMVGTSRKSNIEISISLLIWIKKFRIYSSKMILLYSFILIVILLPLSSRASSFAVQIWSVLFHSYNLIRFFFSNWHSISLSINSWLGFLGPMDSSSGPKFTRPSFKALTWLDTFLDI